MICFRFCVDVVCLFVPVLFTDRSTVFAFDLGGKNVVKEGEPGQTRVLIAL